MQINCNQLQPGMSTVQYPGARLVSMWKLPMLRGLFRRGKKDLLEEIGQLHLYRT